MFHRRQPTTTTRDTGPRLTALLFLGLALAPLVRLGAQEVQVGFRCSIRSRELVKLYGPQAPKIARSWCETVREQLADDVVYPTLSLWPYRLLEGHTPERASDDREEHRCDQVLPPPQETDVRAWFDLVLCDGEASQTRLELHLSTPDSRFGTWRGNYRGPGDLGADPKVDEASREFARLTRAVIFERHTPGLVQALKQIPLAVARWTERERGRLVSSLRWEDYERLRCSEFRVACQLQGRPLRHLDCVGQLEPDHFEPPPPASRYEALVVEAKEGAVSADDLARLEPRLLYIESYKQPSVCDLDVW